MNMMPTESDDSSSQQNNKVVAVDPNADVELVVREFFADIPLMIEIAKAESRFRQFEKDGKTPLMGKQVKEDTGVFQINTRYHLARSLKLGYDINTLSGNMAYARRLYEEQGPQPWSSSYPMWGKSPLAANYKPRTRAKIVTVQAQPSTSQPIVSVSAATSVATTPEAGTPVSAVTSEAIIAENAPIVTPVIAEAIAPVAQPITSVLTDK